MTIAQTSDLWWKSAIIYCLDVETFADSNGDGIGDFNGLTDRLDYLAGVGFTCLWLMPFYPSPNRDDGYDISDVYNVDHRLGTLGDFVVFMRTAKDRGLFRPVATGRYGPAAINVADQQRDPDSLLTWVEKMIRTRKEAPEIGWCQPKILETSDKSVMAHRCDWEGKSMVAIHNFSDEPKVVRVELDRAEEKGQLHDLLGDGVASPDIIKGSIELKLDVYGYRWFRIHAPG